MEDVRIFYERLVYFTEICYILWPFGIFCGILVYFRVGICIVPRKTGNPG
jgi:hypothetical protein